MAYGSESLENQFNDFVEEVNKRIEELESIVRSLQSEVQTAKRDTRKVVSANLEIKNSLGSTIKTVGDIVKKANFGKQEAQITVVGFLYLNVYYHLWMLEKTYIAEQGFNKSIENDIDALRTEIANLKSQIEELQSSLKHYEMEATRSL